MSSFIDSSNEWLKNHGTSGWKQVNKFKKVKSGQIISSETEKAEVFLSKKVLPDHSLRCVLGKI